MPMIYVAGDFFKTKSSLINHIRKRIINADSGTRDGDYKVIDHKHDAFLLDLLKQHPFVHEKLPEHKTFKEFRAYYKGTPRPNYPRQWHRADNNLVIAYGDGSLMDFSWCKLVNGFNEYYRTKQAFRNAIDYQCKIHRSKVINTIGKVSEISGKNIAGPGVVHHDQITFQALVESFLVTYQYSWKSFDPKDEVLPPNVEGQWKLYHETHARLLFISEAEHKEIHKGK